MATQRDVRRIALSLPGAFEEEGRFSFAVGTKSGSGKGKAFAWVWLERIEPKKARMPNKEVLALRVSGEEEKQLLIEAAPKKFFTEPHYNGYPAVLVRLPKIGAKELRALLVRAWKCQAPKAAVKAFDGADGDS
jgi:hypothetical protein